MKRRNGPVPIVERCSVYIETIVKPAIIRHFNTKLPSFKETEVCYEYFDHLDFASSATMPVESVGLQLNRVQYYGKIQTSHL